MERYGGSFQVTVDNFEESFDEIVEALKGATVVGVDLEFSGMGRHNIHAKELPDRYASLCNVARNYAIIELGLSVFHETSEGVGASEDAAPTATEAVGAKRQRDTRKASFKAQSWNILLRPHGEFSSMMSSMSFLARNGFDFNKQLQHGVQFWPLGRNKHGGRQASDAAEKSLALLVQKIFNSDAKVAVHNGFLDLVFLYYNFRQDLPSHLSSFVSDLSKCSPIYDTKYMAEFGFGYRLSFLEYVVRRCERRNETKPVIEVTCSPALRRHKKQTRESKEACKFMQRNGVCKRGDDCQFSHHVDDLLDVEFGESPAKKRRPDEPEDGEETTATDQREASEAPMDDKDSLDYHAVNESTGMHGAAADAFGTGYSFLYFVQQPSFSAAEMQRRLYLTGKTFPLQIFKSQFRST